MKALISMPDSSPIEGGRQMAVVAKHLMLGRLLGQDPGMLASQAGIAPHVVDHIKSSVAAAIGGSGWGSNVVAGGESPVTTAFISALRHSSIFFRLLDLGPIVVPFYQRLGLFSVGATAWTVGEGKPRPLTSIGLNDAMLQPTTVSSLVVASKDWLKATNAEESLNTELRRGVSAEVDRKFFDLVIDGSTPTIASTGDDLDDVVLDIRSLVAAVNPTAESRLLFATTPNICQALATMTTLTGGAAFPNIGLLGGELLDVPLIVTGALADGEFALIDATGLIMNRGDISLKLSEESAIEMLDAALQQDGSTAAGAALASLWQLNLVAVKTDAIFGAKRHPSRDNAVAKLTGVTWGGAVVPS